MKYQKKPVVIDATQWFKNGDHPLDYSEKHQGLEGGKLITFMPEERQRRKWEGDIVRYFRRPDVPGETPCGHCGKVMNDHGWIDTLEGGHIVCPGDFIITGVKGEHYPCKPDIFAASYLSPRPTMDQLAHRETVPELWSDKRSPRPTGEIYVCHDYLKRYDREWSKWRDEPIRLLEIGLNVGASVKLWLDYFTKAHIVGMDIADFVPKVELSSPERFTFFKGSQFSPYDLQRLLESQPMFDIVIDDGAHASGPIIMSFDSLWPHVNPGGYYVIEDLREVKNPASHTPGFPDQRQFAESLLGRVIMGETEVDEAFVSKDLLMLRKKL